MPEKETVERTPLEARSPYELRVNLGKAVPESDVRTALKTGDMGFLHSFTTGSAVDGPGVRVVAWTTGCMFRCLYCHNPDTWTMSNGIPVTVAKATEELRKYRGGLQVMKGGFTLSGGEALMQDRFAVKLFTAARKMGIHTALDTNGYFGDRLTGFSAAIKDKERFPEGWGYVSFMRDGSSLLAKSEPFRKEQCFDCHATHAATDNVFTQFYPLLRR